MIATLDMRSYEAGQGKKLKTKVEEIAKKVQKMSDMGR